MQPCIKRIRVTRLRKEYHLWDILESLGYNGVQKPLWKVARNHWMLASNFFLKGHWGSCAQIYEQMYPNNAMILTSSEDSMNNSHRQSESDAGKSIYQGTDGLYSPGSDTHYFYNHRQVSFLHYILFSHHEVVKEIEFLWRSNDIRVLKHTLKSMGCYKMCSFIFKSKVYTPRYNYLIMQRWKFLQNDAL